MRTTLRRIFTSLYTVAMIGFLCLAFALVATQIVGLLLVQGAWIEGASEVLLRPAIVTAVIAGFFGFCVYNTEGTPAIDNDQD